MERKKKGKKGKPSAGDDSEDDGQDAAESVPAAEEEPTPAPAPAPTPSKGKKGKKEKKGKKTAEPVVSDKMMSTPTAAAPAAAPAAKSEGKVTVSRISIGGVAYLKSSTNILYKPDTKEEVGLYDPINKKIIPLPEEDAEEVKEEEYESEIEM